MALAILPGCVLHETLTVALGIDAKIATALVTLLRWLSIHYRVRRTRSLSG